MNQNHWIFRTLAVATIVLPSHGLWAAQIQTPGLSKEGAPPIAFYQEWSRQKAAVLKEIESRYGKRFSDFDAEDYRTFLAGINLNLDAGLMTWSIVTDIPVVAVTKKSDFFYFNAHLLPRAQGRGLSFDDKSRIQTRYNARTNEVILRKDGKQLPTRPVPANLIRQTEVTEAVTHNKGFALDEVNYGALEPYLALPRSIPNREQIALGINSLPLNMVKTLKGKGIYLSQEPGRGYALTQPVSNDVYPFFAGFTPGMFLEANTAQLTATTFVHELCHVVDSTVMQSKYGTVYFPYQYPGLQSLYAKKIEVIPDRETAVKSDVPGYISDYSRTNNQEEFAEHCRAFILDNENFNKQALSEEGDGHPALLAKYNFMQEMLNTPPTVASLSEDYILASISSGSKDEICLADLYEITRIVDAIRQVLKVDVDCKVINPVKVASPNLNYYYVGSVYCRGDSKVGDEAIGLFSRNLRQAGYDGYFASNNDGISISGQYSTRSCAGRSKPGGV